jgi:SsrA-binding protein
VKDRRGQPSQQEGAPYTRALASNRRAFHEYHILDRFEAGLALTGTEVKAARTGKIQLQDGFVHFLDGQAFLNGVHIGGYSHGNRENHVPVRPRKLLLHRREIDKLYGRTLVKGMTVVPLSLYLKGNKLKAEIALVQGKKLFDKRMAEKERELDNEAREAFKEASRGH